MKRSKFIQLIKENIEGNLLNERFINLNQRNEIEPYIDQIWDIMQKTYSYLDGGFATANSPEELLKKVSFAKLVKKDDKIVAAALYKDQLGKKSIAKGSDGSREGITWVKKIYEEDLKFERAWGELSGKAEKLAFKLGGVPIPNTFAEKLLGKEIKSLNPDGFHYTREINGADHEKIIFGNYKEGS